MSNELSYEIKSFSPADSNQKTGAFLKVNKFSQTKIDAQILVTHMHINQRILTQIINTAYAMLYSSKALSYGREMEIDIKSNDFTSTSDHPLCNQISITLILDSCTTSTNKLVVEISSLLKIRPSNLDIKISCMNLKSLLIYSDPHNLNISNLINSDIDIDIRSPYMGFQRNRLTKCSSKFYSLEISHSSISNLIADCMNKIKFINSQCILSTIALFSHRSKRYISVDVYESKHLSSIMEEYVEDHLPFIGYKDVVKNKRNSIYLRYNNVLSYCKLSTISLTDNSSILLLNYCLSIAIPLESSKSISRQYMICNDKISYMLPKFYIPFTIDKNNIKDTAASQSIEAF